MAAQNGAGLAAPQIGVPLQVVIFGVEHNPRYPDAEPVPYTELVNPVLTPLSRDMEEDWEGCLSVPGLRGVVPRYTHLRYEGFDPHGQPIRREVTGFHARVVQHECDHLLGHPVSDAHARLLALRLHRRAVPRWRRRAADESSAATRVASTVAHGLDAFDALRQPQLLVERGLQLQQRLLVVQRARRRSGTRPRRARPAC